MSGIVEVKKSIRRAIQIPLQNAANAQSPPLPVQWTGAGLDRPSAPNYFAAEVGFSAVEITEIGPNPRFQANGVLTVVCWSELKLREDGNDALARIAATAYPYASTLVFDGVTVHVDKMSPGGYGIDGAWMTGLLTVDWTVYRRD